MDKYDPKKGIKLNTYAFLRIKGAMIDELRLRDWFPKNARLKTKKIEEVIKGLEAKLGRYPEEEEVAAELKMDMDEYFSMIRDYKNLSVLSIEDIYETVGLDRERIMRYALEEADDYEAYVEFHELESIIAKEFERLSEKQRIVLALYYQEDMNMKEIGAVLGVTEARVCQIHAQAILNLRTFLKEYL